MKVGLKTTITQLPKKALNGVNGLGSSMRELAKENVDKFSKTKPAQGLKKAGINKDTALGAALILMAIGSAVRIGVGIKNRVDESKQILKQ